MTKKAFSILLLTALVLGVSLGAAFAAGFAVGRGQDSGTADGTLAQRPSSEFAGGPQGGDARGAGPEAGSRAAPEGGEGERPEGQRAEPRDVPGEGERQRAEGRNDEPAAAQREFSAAQDTGGTQRAGRANDGGGGSTASPAPGQTLFGTIAGFDGNSLAVESPRGPVSAAVTESTVFLKTVPAAAEDLAPGSRVWVSGRPADGGPVQARSITLIPAAAGNADELPIGSTQRRVGGFSLSGTIAGIAEGLVTISGGEGETEVALSEATTIQRLEVASKTELMEGAPVRIAGSPGADGVVQAASVILAPEGSGRPSRRGFQNP